MLQRYRSINRTRRALLLGLGLLLALILLAVLSAGAGQFQVSAAEIVAALGRKLQLLPGEPGFADATLWNVRFPRVVMAILVGAALGLSGAVMQAVFANPLAEPAVIGISAGSAVGASAVIVFGGGAAGLFGQPLAAFVAGLLTTVLVYLLSRVKGKASVLTLVLTGISVNALASAVIALLVFLADTQSREQIVFWQMGSLNGSTWAAVLSVLLPIGLGIVLCFLLLARLDVLALGERAAGHVGLSVEGVRMIAILAVALMTSGAVAYSGIIGFVGLIVPHLIRLAVGPSAKRLLPLSLLGGALMVSLADLAARTLIPFADLPIGIFTALVGAPAFFLLLRQTLKKSGAL
ncbi:FecCD family ABC transporter permease [Psychromicrobium lacuslunae]|uniref:ABC transporter permease n=1 Tax=Psychromicrobium lacuslunae TaxID=1618207 RepID=A0A0D4BZI5_9MICC|nr:iron ABC transporter permease [Psychromicrobium lacuslunae]AJT41545.1 hypothetical protein UM93_08525 [Psychromicrobium lacuslunae]